MTYLAVSHRVRGFSFPAALVFLATAILCALVACSPLAAQTSAGRILGSVHDQSDAAVANASVVITDVQRGVSRTLTTDESGEYLAPDLTPGTYKVHVEAKGFNSVEQTGILLEVAKDARVDFVLKPGDSSQVVTVNFDVPMVDSTSSALGGTLSNREINDLPLNGRNYENLLQLRPGVVRYPGGGFSTTSSNGLRAEDNAYFVDGLFNSEPFSGQSIINGAGIAGDSATILPIDAIQEFNVIQNPPAEYGWKPGTMVNVGLKSGTNALHGTAYGFFRTTSLDARNYYNPAPFQKAPRNLKQFGSTLGGPIVKDKLFFFGTYEGQRYTVGNVGQITTPATVTLATPPTVNCAFTGAAGGDCANSAVNAIADVQAAGLSVSAASLKIAGCTLGPPISCDGTGIPLNNGTNPAGTTTLNFGLPNSVSVDGALGKIDYQVNSHNSFSGLYFFGNNNGTVQDAQQLQTKWLTQIHTRAQVLGLNWIWTPNSSWVNEARFGYNRLYQPTFPNDHTVAATAYGLNTGVTNPLYGGLPRINVKNFFNFPLGGIGGFNWPKVQGPDDRYQFVDHISRTIGKHGYKFGGELHRDGFTGGAYGGTRGRFKFLGGTAFTNGGISSSPIEDFFAGQPANGSLLIGDPTRHIHNWGFALFVQDDWRVTSRLTLNLGLRYELSMVIKDSRNQLANFDPQRGLIQVGKGISGPYNIDPYNFAPRAGFAWDISGNNKTVIRGGAGIIYETLNWESFLALNNNIGLSTIPTAGTANVTPGTGDIATGLITFFPPDLKWNATGGATVFPNTPLDCRANPCTIMGITQNFKTPLVYTWNLNIQRALNSKITLETAYVGNHGSKLAGIHDINQPTVGAGWAPCIASNYDPNLCTAPTGDEQGARPFNAKFPFLAQIYQMGNVYRSNYNGLQLTLNGRDYHGLSFLLGYTYSHALDNVGANWDFGAGSGLPQDNLHPYREYGSSDFDMRHRFTLSLTYNIPGIKNRTQLLDGWQVNTIVSVFSAQPWGPIDTSTDVSGTGEATDRWNFFGRTADFKPMISSGIPFFPTGSPACLAKAKSLDGGGATGPNQASLGLFGCYAVGNSIMLPPAIGTFGTMGRNTFRDLGFRNVDFSTSKNFRFGERLNMQFRAEFFNIFNHPNFANPFGGQNGWGKNDPSSPPFGCSCATPDVAASNPVIGSGGSRAVQLGLKLIF
ncbi:MAG TPA: TonB-dependent receptor [Candidatus Dormibacteraeota bacterium]|nr:TonB-dependent receptor [Candidatus Dormibacteraeota bacterium]